MIAVNVDELFVSWLAAQLPGVNVASERPAKLEERLPFVVIRRGGGGDLDMGLDSPIVDVDCYAAPTVLNGVSAAGSLAGRVDDVFRQATPAGWRGRQFTLLRCNQAPIKVSDSNTAVRHYAATYTFSLL